MASIIANNMIGMARAFKRTIAVSLLAALPLAACGTTADISQSSDPLLRKFAETSIDEYRLGANDRLKVTVFGEPDLSGEFQVDAGGQVSLPLIGEVAAQGLTPRQFEREVEEKFANGYLQMPRISAEIINYRPFYIGGEVNTPGQYPFEPGLTIQKAVATAGGYTYRANRSRVEVVRKQISDRGIRVPADTAVLVMPGDVITVPERVF